MGCSFCASTIGGCIRNLTPGEMLGQIYEAMNFTKEDYIYTTGINILKKYPEKGLLLDFHQISIDLYRYLIGFVGAATILIIINILYYPDSAVRLNSIIP